MRHLSFLQQLASLLSALILVALTSLVEIPLCGLRMRTCRSDFLFCFRCLSACGYKLIHVCAEKPTITKQLVRIERRWRTFDSPVCCVSFRHFFPSLTPISHPAVSSISSARRREDAVRRTRSCKLQKSCLNNCLYHPRVSVHSWASSDERHRFSFCASWHANPARAVVRRVVTVMQ